MNEVGTIDLRVKVDNGDPVHLGSVNLHMVSSETWNDLLVRRMTRCAM